MASSSSTIDWKEILILFFCIIGSFTIFTKIFKLLKWVYSIVIRSPKNLITYGSWALLTGSTDGIGKSLSFDLASKGLNLILVARNPQKLETTCNEIWEKYSKEKTKIKVIVIDFEKISGEEIEHKIKKEIEGLDVGILINNVGSSAYGARFFHEVGSEGMSSLVNVNIHSVNSVTKAIIPGMLQRRKGAIVNIGSGSGVVVPSYPLYSLYAASKGLLRISAF